MAVYGLANDLSAKIFNAISHEFGFDVATAEF